MNQSLLFAIALILVIVTTQSTFLLLTFIGLVVYFKFFYIQTMKIEPYTNSATNSSLASDPISTLPSNIDNLRICSSSQNRFCNDVRPVPMNQDYVSVNHALVGKPIGLTYENPVIIAPAMAWDYWSTPNVIPTGINTETNFDAFRSGYMTCGSDGNDVKESFDLPTKPITDDKGTPKIWVNEKGTEGDMVTCTYNPNQMMEYNIPSNVQAGSCMQQPEMRKFNKNLFTTNLGPNTYNELQMVEPIQSNMGITFQQQLPPVTKRVNPDGSTTFVTKDPRIIEPGVPVPSPASIADASNIYDPRSKGYGTSYRAYTDPMTGRTRFMYDDINAIRNPNFVIRSNIDHNAWANAYGPMEDHIQRNRALAQQQFTNDTLQQREELQEMYMNKVNRQVMWQRRMAPIRTTQITSTNSSSYRR